MLPSRLEFPPLSLYIWSLFLLEENVIGLEEKLSTDSFPELFLFNNNKNNNQLYSGLNIRTGSQ